jgi:NAD(P)-dependent dehydrogenase (short-subunit alcohol dehydrogenase family)
MSSVRPEDQVAVVTGASSGIGAALARHLAGLGRRVVTLQRRRPEFAGRVGAGSVEHLEVDLMASGAAAAAGAELARRYAVGYLVNNAGVNRPGGIAAVTDDDLEAVWKLNVKAPIALVQALLPGMRERGFGRIVSLSSRAVLGKTERIAYASSKAGLIGLTRSLALEVAAAGVTVNVVAPGPVASELFDNGHPIGSDKRAQVIRSVPVQRVGTPQDIAHAVAFFLAPESGFITGQTLFVCGGLSISGAGGQ